MDCEHSESAPVDSGVPKGTVLGPLMFLCHINVLPDTVKSQVRIFADHCLLYRQIKSQTDHLILQNYLIELEKWAAKWDMRFNAKKCYILSIRQKSSRFYQGRRNRGGRAPPPPPPPPPIICTNMLYCSLQRSVILKKKYVCPPPPPICKKNYVCPSPPPNL